MISSESETITDCEALRQMNEFFAAGLCEQPEALPMARYARAYRRWFERCPLEDYADGLLYPCGKKTPGADQILIPSYSFTCAWNETAFREKRDAVAPEKRHVLDRLRDLYDAQNLPVKYITTPHTVGGRGYTHAIVNYGRVLSEGLDAYLGRVEAGMKAAREPGKRDFYCGLADLVAGIRIWHGRLVAHLEAAGIESENGRRLIRALTQVPFKPARNFYEALVAYNVVYYIDGCDNPGRMDQVLWPYYERDASVDHEEALLLMQAFYENVCANGGWSLAIGGSHADDRPAYQEMTEICIAASHEKYRPSLELRVREDMPGRIWDLSMDALATGCGQPAFYNERGYLDALRVAGLKIADEDIVKWNGGGCTETMLHGCSNVGSLDAGLNLLLILEGTLKRVLVRDDVSFDEILEAYKADVRATVADVVAQLNAYFEARAAEHPQPVRSLLMDDCIDRGLDFNAGGARYNWSVVNVAGLSNVVDSLEAVRDVVFRRKAATSSQLLGVLERNFGDDEPLRQMMLSCAKFGNDVDGVDALAAELSAFVYEVLLSHPHQRGGKFLPSHIMFETFAHAGQKVGATPDGRLAGEPLADSSGPVQGRDTNGPTAMLKSVARLEQRLVAGTPILNLRFSKATISRVEGRRHIRALIETYFQMGGLQVQISVLDQAALLDAMDHPEQHENLIVRIGGYSTYFNRLSDALKREVIKRTEYVL